MVLTDRNMSAPLNKVIGSHCGTGAIGTPGPGTNLQDDHFTGDRLSEDNECHAKNQEKNG
jgi:hypothetical protein